jgi:L-threonylcarbamoyladenylate synthase
MSVELVDKRISSAVEVLLRGGLVALPTETVYGLGADATNDVAVQKIFQVKGRPSNNPLILHFASLEAMLPYIDLSRGVDASKVQSQLRALSVFWPGALSVVVPRGRGVSDAACAGGSTVAVRIPNHPVALALLTAFGRPVAAPSANPSSYISPTTADHVRDSLGDKVDLILDGGPCTVGVESTVLSLVHEVPTVLRPGAVTAEALSEVLGVAVSTHAGSKESETLLSPGLLSKHYSPKTKVVFMSDYHSESSPNLRIGAVLFSADKAPSEATECRYLSKTGAFEDIATGLFGVLRELDTLDLDLIVVDSCDDFGLGTAIMDRLRRATR